MEVCDKIADILAQPATVGSVEEYEDFVAQWRSLDKTSKRSSPKIEEKFLTLIEHYLERVPDLSVEERSALLVKLQVERLKNSPDASHKLHQREQTIRREISQLQNDIQTLRTNIEFFARSKNADKLREEYEGRIADAQKRIDQLQMQLNAFRG
jgi:Mg2+ and Co2+ transporter CorA